jgi:hypothetical protein
MGRAFTQFAFSPALNAAQARYGARDHGERLGSHASRRETLTDELIGFIATPDSFFVGTANRNGWPHLQHRGGPAGFLKGLDDRTVAFPDYEGNKQYIAVGNLTEIDQIWGHSAIIDDDPVLFRRVGDPDYPATVARIIRIDVKAWDLSCRRHFPKLVRERSTKSDEVSSKQ